MKKGILYLSGLGFVFLISGCVVRSYPLTRDRVDQDMSGGNRGYLQGEAEAPVNEPERKTTRTTRVVEIELHPPVRFEKIPKPKSVEKTDDSEVWGNRGYITGSAPAETEVVASRHVVEAPVTEKYTVTKNDTLQKISGKFYGTTKKWNKIYEANSSQLKGPNKIYPGQVLMIPLDGPSSAKSSGKKEKMLETQENLK